MASDDAESLNELEIWLNKVPLSPLREFVDSPGESESKASLISRILAEPESRAQAQYSKSVEESVGFVR